MHPSISVLSINGSDCYGQSGIQSDIKTIDALGGYALTAITCVTVQSQNQPTEITNLPQGSVLRQISSIITDLHPQSIKIGLIRDAKAIVAIRNEIIGCRNIVLAPGIHASDGTVMVEDDVVTAINKHLIPISKLLTLRHRDAELLLGVKIATDDDMADVCRQFHTMGAEWILLRGVEHTDGRLTALLYGENTQQFFSSYNTAGWKKHGVASALSAAIATRIAIGDDVPTAVRNAHDYMHSQIVYVKDSDKPAQRPIDIYNSFVSLVADNYKVAHNVYFYADKLCISTRYLSKVTDRVVGKTPKQIIADYILSEAKNFIKNSHLDILEIANKLGFVSGSSFCKFFKKNAGTTPSELRTE